MPKFHTPTHDIPALEQRLKEILEEPPERITFSPVKLSLSRRLVRRFAASGPLPRKIVNGLKGWHLAGYSLRWLLLKVPMVRPVGRRVRAFLYFRRQVISHLHRLEHQLHESNEQIARLVIEQQRHEESLAKQFNAYQALTDDIHLRERISADTQARVVRLEAARGAAIDAENDTAKADYADYYLALENLYRGESSAIEARFEPYLAFMQEAAAGGTSDPVLDLGCGRGEWLSILRRENLNALGVDADAAMLAQARERGENVVQGDLLPFIENASPDSYGGVTAFQVVEHLPLDVLMRLFAAAKRILRPGGVLVLETPNPENLQVSSYSFWLDPTHIRPLPPPLLDYFARYFGFIDIRIVRTHPWPAEQHFPEDTPVANRLNKLLFCEQDYALVARKPL
ncbi:MAG TPA: methyltransferase domain-containing protein [Noviherbaspirillum sp.]|nr:methyltransferase domain-containing protein [Noviherbaspirillum sp.]